MRAPRFGTLRLTRRQELLCILNELMKDVAGGYYVVRRLLRPARAELNGCEAHSVHAT